MHTAITIAFIISLLVTVGILFTGIFVMTRGGEQNRQLSNKLMRMRVVSQLVAIGLFALMLLSGSGH
ncbi:MAG: twin transmembrane helix small protein [Alphaproteobacteria bacterium]